MIRSFLEVSGLIRFVVVSMICSIGISSYGQFAPDGVLTLDAFVQWVKENHPVSKQADLQLQRGNAIVQTARGSFDPKLWMDLDQKYFDEKQYFSHLDGGLKIPTWFGVELSSGFQENEGVFLDPENSTPGGGLFYAGISLPIGQGLFIDERRAMLRKAKLMERSTVEERKLLLNELIFEAGRTWLAWFKAYNSLIVYQEALGLAQFRFDAVKSTALFGDRPYIDTLEAGIQVQTRRLYVQQAELELANARARMAVHLWVDGLIPLEMEEFVRPPLADDLPMAMPPPEIMLMDSVVSRHPALNIYEYQIDQFKIDRRWRAEQLKPVLDLQYKPLTEAIGADPLAGYSIENYRWGLGFSMPILLRKERGFLKLTDVKISEAEFELNMKEAEVVYRIRLYLNEYNSTRDQIALFSTTTRDFRSLLEGERQMFDNGESSLFMVNAREMSYISARVQLLELLVQNRNSILGASFAGGLLAN
ncbi:MAG: TolC family protein [Flavobacteriales bacterium]|nr:TolC family protein [Flavobacteriales bacterium]